MKRALNLIGRFGAMMRRRRAGVVAAIACLAILTLSVPASATSMSGRWVADGNQIVEVSKSGSGYRGYYRTGPHKEKLALQVSPRNGRFVGARYSFDNPNGLLITPVQVNLWRMGNAPNLKHCAPRCWVVETWRPLTVQALDKRAWDRIAPNDRMELAGSKHGCTVYLDPNGSGGKWNLSVKIPHLITTKRTYSKLYNAPGVWDRRVSSLKCEASSRLDCYVAVYTGRDRSGDNASFYGRMGLINLDQYGWDDRIRSLEVFCNRK